MGTRTHNDDKDDHKDENDNTTTIVVFVYSTKIKLVSRIHDDGYVAFTAPRFFLVTRIHDNEGDNTRMIILRSLCLRHQAFFVIVYQELLSGIPRMHNDEDGMTPVRTLIPHGCRLVYYSKPSSCNGEYESLTGILG